MKNCKFDQKGHMLSYENDHGDTIIDTKAVKKAFGSGSGDYDKMSSGGISIHLPNNILMFLVLLGTFFFGGILVILAWLFFAPWLAITLTVIFVLVLLGLGVFMFLG